MEEREIQIGDLIKYHSAGRPPKIATVFRVVRQHGHQWALGLEVGGVKARLYDLERCEVISANQ
jgi:hypothetical protein